MQRHENHLNDAELSGDQPRIVGMAWRQNALP